MSNRPCSTRDTRQGKVSGHAKGTTRLLGTDTVNGRDLGEGGEGAGGRIRKGDETNTTTNRNTNPPSPKQTGETAKYYSWEGTMAS